MATAEIVTLPLALEDAVPVGLSAAGLWIVASESATGAPWRLPWLRAGVVAAATGGAAKATWKLLVVAGHDVAWLQDLLFPCLALGMALLATGVLAARRDDAWVGREAAALVAALILGTAVVSSWATALVVARVVAIVAATMLSFLLVRAAERVDDRAASVLFVANLLATVLLGRLASIEDQTTALQWAEQLVNTASQGAFLAGAVRLRARGALRPSTTMDPARVPTIA